MANTFESIINNLKNKKYEPVYFLCGDEPYYIDSISNYIADNILNDSEKAFNQTVVYGKEIAPNAIIENALRYPMMAQYNILIVKEAQEIKKIDELLPYIENPNKSSILVICYKYKKIDKRTKLYKTLNSNACYFEGTKIYENKVSSWIESYLGLKNFKIKPQASALLTEYLGNDLSKVSNELNKLILIKNENEIIDLDDIEKHIGISKEYNIFELQKALGARDSKKVAKIFNYIKNNPKGNPIQALIGGLFNYFSKLFILAYSGTDFQLSCRELGIMPFLQGEYQKAIKNYHNKLEKVILVLEEFDLKSKGIGDNGTNPTELTKEMLFKILSC